MFMLISCSLHLSAVNQYLLVLQRDGTKTGFALAEKPVIECTFGILSVTSNKYSIAIPITDVENYSLVEKIPSKIPILKYGNGIIDVQSGHVSIDALPSNILISIFGMDGIMLDSYKTDLHGHVEFDLPKHHTFFIIKTPSTSIKIINK